MRTTYRRDDVELLLKDITGLVEPQSTQERERQIQMGRHYCEMLPIEYSPSREYMEVYREALRLFSDSTARAVGILADKILEQRGRKVVLVSLARAGIPVGILLKRYLRWKYGLETPHYSISIIRGRGIDQNAVEYLLREYAPGQLLFVDGWIGKGAILRELGKDVKDFPGVSPELAVLADPANVTSLCGTHEDILIPSSCLNCTVSGLVSRTFLRDDIIGPRDFHGAVYYGELQEQDLSYGFIQEIESRFQMENMPEPELLQRKGLDEVLEIGERFQVGDVNLIKPGIGETTRVLLRRVPWKVLLGENSRGERELEPILRLAKEKQVPVEYYPLKNYKACGIIKKLADA